MGLVHPLFLSKQKGGLSVTRHRRLSWNFVIWLFICGCIVGFITNEESINLFKQQIGVLESKKIISPETMQSVNDKNYQIVAVRDSALKKHPLYPEIEKLAREIATRKIEQKAYDDLLQEWENQKNLANPQGFLQTQSELVTNSLAQLKDALIVQLRKEMVLEKEKLQKESQSQLEKEKKQIIGRYLKQIASEEQQYLQELAYLEKKQNSIAIQAKYSIRVDIGLKNKQTNFTRNDANIQAEVSPEVELKKKQQEWQQRLLELDKEQENELDDLLAKRLASLAKKENEIDIRYREKENYYLQSMTKEVQAAEKRRSELAKALESIEKVSALDQKTNLIANFNDKQRKQLENLVIKKEKLLKRIEQECLEGLNVLAIKKGYSNGILVDKIPENAMDLTKDLLLFLNRQDQNNM